MGCSASRFDTLLAKAIEDPSSLTSSSSSSSSSNSFSSSVIPKSRSISAPLVHHPPLCKGDSNHLVCLTSTTYGSLVVVDKHPSPENTPVGGQSASPDSVINTWELMEGLEEENQFNPDCGNGLMFTSCDFNDVKRKPSSKIGVNVCDSGDNLVNFCDVDVKRTPSSKIGLNVCDSCDKLMNSCDFVDVKRKPASKIGVDVCDSGDSLVNSCDFIDAKTKPILKSGLNLSESFVFVEMPKEIVEKKESSVVSSSKPLWKHLSEESLLSKMDPNVESTYERAITGRKLGYDPPRRMSKSVSSIPSTIQSKSVGSSPLVLKLPSENECRVLGLEDKIVLYFTSLRGIRRTYEDCCSVRMILRGFRVMVDERDISMDSNYRKELQNAVGGKVVSLPQLFIKGRHIGGADEIKQLHENGELERFFDGFPIRDHGFACGRCGESRFVPCSNCNGSRKVFLEAEGQTRRCPDCNENGLVRCPGCCS